MGSRYLFFPHLLWVGSINVIVHVFIMISPCWIKCWTHDETQIAVFFYTIYTSLIFLHDVFIEELETIFTDVT